MPRDVPNRAESGLGSILLTSSPGEGRDRSGFTGKLLRNLFQPPQQGKFCPALSLIDDTGFRKYGKHSVGVARQYCGHLGKTDNCQVAVSLSLATIKMRWRIERDYRELKQEVGLGHYEGRNWRGVHHHASLCIAAYGFLMLERLYGSKKNSARLKAPPLPEGFRPRGAGSDAAAHPVVDHHRALSPGSGHRPTSSTMSVLRETVRAGR